MPSFEFFRESFVEKKNVLVIFNRFVDRILGFKKCLWVQLSEAELEHILAHYFTDDFARVQCILKKTSKSTAILKTMASIIFLERGINY